MKLNFNNTTVDISPNGGAFTLQLDDRTLQAEILNMENDRLDLRIDGERVTAYVSSENSKRWVTVNGQTFVLTIPAAGTRRGGQARQTSGELTAPMPGQVRAVNVSEGDTVAQGQTLMVLEAMKMEIRIHSPQDGVVKKLYVKQSQTVEREQVLIEIDEI